MRNRLLATLLLTLPSMVAMVPAVAHSGRTIDIALSRSAMVPQEITIQAGERVRVRMTSADSRYACHVSGLGGDAQIPAGGATVTVDLTPTQTGIFQIECIDDGGLARESVQGRFVVKPER
jgi:heme/copper-type cytochrome/quinol oxidase subunit 2